MRLTRRPDGEWAPQGSLYVPGLTSERLRTLPLVRILLAVAADEALQNELVARLDDDVPEAGATNEFHKVFTNWSHAEPLTLERPGGRKLSDDFYARVADVYRAATVRGLRPRTAIAEAAGVSSEVAGRWVREARKRDLLPETTPGRVRA